MTRKIITKNCNKITQWIYDQLENNTEIKKQLENEQKTANL